jgi:hypothetical protein
MAPYKLVQDINIYIYLFSSITNKMQCYTICLFLQNALLFQAVPPPIIRSSKTIHTASGIRQAITATFHCRGGVGTGLSVLLEVY